jgi:hypothetical protein
MKYKMINKYLALDLAVMLIYGLVLYFGFTWIAGYSILLAYLWNFALIFCALLLDAYTLKMVYKDKVKRMEYVDLLIAKGYGAKKVYGMLTGGFLSFKTIIYLFYLFVLIISQIIDFNPTLITENIANFILANNYSILFLVAFDMLINQFKNDKERMDRISEELREYLSQKESSS